jgi:glycosyltransferase involved in cell wall biosynthesis
MQRSFDMTDAKLRPMRILIALPGLHRYNRGAEVAFVSIADSLARTGNDVTLIGSGPDRAGAAYKFIHAGSIDRKNFEAFPYFPFLRNECAYEELTFVPGLLNHYHPESYDVTLTCGYPFTNWALRRPRFGRSRPAHIFVTENGDWPAFSSSSEYRFFRCDGLVCTNPEFYERNKSRWRSKLIPNGIDCDRFRPGPPQREAFGLPADRLVVLMVSALVPNKRVEMGIEAVSRLPNAHLVVAGDGPLRQTVDANAARLLPGRFTRLTVAPERMAALYQSADVFLHLCKDESFGNVFLEAMACGRPIVAHDCERVRWIVGDNEFLVDTDRAENVAKEIMVAHDAALAGREKRLARALEFSWNKIGVMYRDFFNEVVGAKISG